MISKFRKYLPLFFIFVLGLTPIIWFLRKPGYIINGTDTNFPFDLTSWWGQRFFVFYDVINDGVDWPTATSGIFFHSLQLIAYMISGNFIITELTTVVFWFFLILFSMYYLLGVLFEGKYTGPRLLGAVFYGFNIYLFNTWENIKVSNLSLVACTPFLIAFLYQGVRHKNKRPFYLLYTFIVSFIASGAGINPAYFIVLIFVIVSFGLFLIFENKKQFNSNFKTVSFFVFVTFVANSFWIFPLAASLLGVSGRQLSTLSDFSGLSWIDGLSKHTSVLSVIRLLGAWDWYEVGKENIPYVPFAHFYFSNPFFIFISLLIPAFCLLGAVLNKKNSLSLFFLFLAVIGIILGTGTHEPFGIFYRLATRFIPYFNLFRSPWYIFTPIVTISFAILLAYFGKVIHERLGKFKANLFTWIFVLLLLIYAYPLISGEIFRPNKEIGQSLYVKPPSYLWEAKDYLKSSPLRDFLSMPFEETESFTWGYSGVGSILNLISDKNIFVPRFGVKDKNIVEILSLELSKSASLKLENKILGLASLLGVDGFFLKQDLNSIDERSEIIPWFGKLSFGKHKRIGTWHFISLRDESPEIFIAKEGVSAFGNKEKIPHMFDFLPKQTRRIIYPDILPHDFFTKNQPSIFIFPECIDCLLLKQREDITAYAPGVLPSSRFYPYSEKKDEAKVNKIATWEGKLDFYRNSSLRISSEIEQMTILKQKSDVVIETMERLTRIWGKIKDILLTVDQQKEESKSYFDNILETERYLKKVIGLFYGLTQSSLTTFDERRVSFEILDELLAIERELKNRSWISTNLEKRFLFSVPETGYYRVFLQEEPYFTSYFNAPISSSEVVTDEQRLTMLKNRNKMWLESHKKYLKIGLHKLEVKLPESINMLTGSTKAATLSMETTTDAKKITFPIKNFIPGKMHGLTFYYRTEQGFEPHMYIEQDTDKFDKEGKILHGLDVHLDRDIYWRRYETNFVPRLGTRSMNLVLVVPFLNNMKSMAQIKDLKAEIAYEPQIMLFNDIVPFTFTSEPKIQFTKNSPTMYTIEIKDAKGPFPLIFLRKFSQAWKVRAEGSLEWLPEDSHFMVNGYANGWIINKEGNFKLVIEYWPQYLFYLGGLFGLLTFMYLIMIVFRKLYVTKNFRSD